MNQNNLSISIIWRSIFYFVSLISATLYKYSYASNYKTVIDIGHFANFATQQSQNTQCQKIHRLFNSVGHRSVQWRGELKQCLTIEFSFNTHITHDAPTHWCIGRSFHSLIFYRLYFIVMYLSGKPLVTVNQATILLIDLRNSHPPPIR